MYDTLYLWRKRTCWINYIAGRLVYDYLCKNHVFCWDTKNCNWFKTCTSQCYVNNHSHGDIFSRGLFTTSKGLINQPLKSFLKCIASFSLQFGARLFVRAIKNLLDKRQDRFILSKLLWSMCILIQVIDSVKTFQRRRRLHSCSSNTVLAPRFSPQKL